MNVRISWNAPDASALGAAALNNAVEYIAGIVEERTPYLEGDLRRSRVVHHATPGNLEAGITFHTPYARVVHELANATFTTPGTGSHYLEGPWMEHADEIRAIIANTLRGGMQ